MISIEKYESVYKGMPKAEVNRLRDEGKLSPIEARYINKANATHKIKPINPIIILCGVQTMHINDVGRDSRLHSSTISILTRPVSMFILTAAVTMFKGAWVGIGDASAILDKDGIGLLCLL